MDTNFITNLLIISKQNSIQRWTNPSGELVPTWSRWRKVNLLETRPCVYPFILVKIFCYSFLYEEGYLMTILSNWLIHRLKNLKAYITLYRSNSIENFWDVSHKNNISLWLTGSDPNYIVDYYKLSDHLNSKRKILNVGVGLGTCTNFYFKSGHEISALDISKEALNRVKSFTYHTYLTSEIDSIPDGYFDLIIQHLVVQHMSYLDFTLQFKELLKKIDSKSGKYCVQFATGVTLPNDTSDSTEICKGGGVLYSEDKIKSLLFENDISNYELELTNEWANGAGWYRLIINP